MFSKSIFVVAALLMKAKQQHGLNENKNTSFFYNSYEFCCCAYQNKQKIKSSFMRTKNYFTETKRNETLFFKKRNEKSLKSPKKPKLLYGSL
jgi:hypothetical protein